MCGEKPVVQIHAVNVQGSPPRVRGKVLCPDAFAAAFRITPACAGKRLHLLPVSTVSGDHPRVCGEKPLTALKSRGRRGSPPRVRGKAVLVAWSLFLGRITPACAGKSHINERIAGRAWDHPRVCGEKQKFFTKAAEKLGSPPRVRGKEQLETVPKLYTGITPACAGKRLKRFHSIGHFSCILCLFHSVLHRASVSGGSRAGPCAPPCLPAQNAVPV